MAISYATPSTQADFTTLINGIHWDVTNCNADTEDLLARLSAIILGWRAMRQTWVSVVQDAYPSQNDWETAWLAMGNTLPITATNIHGLWENTATNPDNKDVTEYVCVDGKFYPKLAYWWHGSSDITVTNASVYTNVASTLPITNLTTTDTKLIDLTVFLQKNGWVSATFGGYFISNVNPETTPVQMRMNSDIANYTRVSLPIDYLPHGSLVGISTLLFWRYLSDTILAAGAQNISSYYRKAAANASFYRVAFKSDLFPTLKYEAGAWPYYAGEQSAYFIEVIYP